MTAAPQARQFCRVTGLGGDALSDRVKQWLGLAPQGSYSVFVELWVKPADLLRPCPDPEIGDKYCNIAFAMRDGMPVDPPVAGLESYRAFFDQLYLTAYKPGGAPWTRLGYTYDWNPETPIYGASEYIITPGKKFEIADAMPIADYCKK